MRLRRTCLLLACSLLPGAALAATKDAERQSVRDMAGSTLAELCKTQPQAKGAIERSAGYAVFSNFGMNILVAGGGSGSGVAVNTKSKRETVMKMGEVQAGLGFGMKKFRLVWVFEKASDLDNFIKSGWELGAQATAAAQLSGQGAEVFAYVLSVSPGVWL